MLATKLAWQHSHRRERWRRDERLTPVLNDDDGSEAAAVFVDKRLSNARWHGG